MRQKIHSPHEAIKGFQNEHVFRVVLTETFETKSSCRGISQLHSWKKGNLQFFSSAFAMTSKKHPSNLNHPSWFIHSTLLQHIVDSSNQPSKYSKPILHGTGLVLNFSSTLTHETLQPVEQLLLLKPPYFPPTFRWQNHHPGTAVPQGSKDFRRFKVTHLRFQDPKIAGL